MKSGREGMVVGYNAQKAVDAKHQLVVHHELTQAGGDNQQLEPVTEATRNALAGELFQKSDLTYLPNDDAYRCPAGKLLRHKTINTQQRLHLYVRTGCSQCPLQGQCTTADRRWVTRHFHEQALEQAQQQATPERMVRRMAPFRHIETPAQQRTADL